MPLPHVARIDRQRKKKGSNDDCTHPHDPDARITTMKDGRTHLAHKAEHAVDLETGAVFAVTVQPADEGDTTTSRATLIEAAEQIEAALVDYDAVGLRTHISEIDRGRRNCPTYAAPPSADRVRRLQI